MMQNLTNYDNSSTLRFIHTMRNKRLFILILLLTTTLQTFAQIKSSVTRGNNGSRELVNINKEIALNKSKVHLVKFLGSDTTVTKFELDPLVQQELGEELTSLIFRCDEKNISGMLFTFYNLDMLEEGAHYIKYGYKILNDTQAHELISKLDELAITYKDYLKENQIVNNIYFEYEDITFIMHWDNKFKIRLLWEDFDSEWESISYGLAKRKLGIK